MLGGRDDLRSQSVTDKWVPKSATKRDAPSVINTKITENNKHDSDDVIFRTIRGILNKLTPQTFDRLTDELIRTGLDSQARLKGLILLIFEKALQEPKYVCMYAALCKKISTKVPNFDKIPDGQPNITTFQRLLLSKCQDEFENRARASSYFDNKTGTLTPDEEEDKMVAKRKMLGNINFIGELCKIEMLTHTILYKCAEELIKKGKAEDLECLAQIMINCGHLLDTDKGKKLMDQYFLRIAALSKNDKLAPRILFMLQDVAELRENGWHSRTSKTVKERPKLIDDIRKEAAEELGIDLSETDSGIEEYRPFSVGVQKRSFNPRRKTGMEDVFGPFPFAMATTLGTGPGVITQGDSNPLGLTSGIFPDVRGGAPPPNYQGGSSRHFHADSNNMNQRNAYHAPPNFNRGGVRQENDPSRHNRGHVPNGNNKIGYNNPQQRQQYGAGPGEPFNIMRNQSHGHARNGIDNKASSAAIAPRFQRQGQGPQGPVATGPSETAGHGPTAAVGNYHHPREQLARPTEPVLRPMTKSFAAPPGQQLQQMPYSNPNAYGGRPFKAAPERPLNASVVHPPPGLNSMHLNGDGPPRPPSAATPPKSAEKGPAKSDLMKKVNLIVEEYLSTKDEVESRKSLQELDIPEKYVTEVVGTILNRAMDRSESDRELVFSLLVHLQQEKPSWITSEQYVDSYHKVLDTMGDLEADIPRIKSYVASFAARSVQAEVLTLAQIAEPMDNGNHYPFLLLVLQQLSKSMEKVKLSKLFEESKIDLLDTLPKADRSKSRLDDILEERRLSFLFPLLRVQSEMMEWLQVDPSPANLLDWILKNVDKEYHKFPGFTNALMTVIFRFVTQEASKSSDTTEKAIKDAEYKLLVSFKPILERFFGGDANKLQHQLIGIYAIQAGWYAMGCPKVTLLRWFMNLYELELFEEEAFLRWKEDLCNDYPGKGKALFQVHQWLIWLAQVDDEDEEEEE